MRYRDRAWMRGLFGQGAFRTGAKSELTREYTLTSGSFADTTIGGNQAINPIPQFTEYADLKTYGYLARGRHSGLVEDGQAGSYGMGRYYGEVIDNHAHVAHFRFGLQKYIGSFSFLTTMHNPDLARLTTDGMFSPFFRTAGKIAATYGLFVILGPAIAVGFFIGSKAINMFLNRDTSKYWYVKPAMHLYLQAVQAMLDNQLVHRRMVPFSSAINSDVPDASEPGSKLYDTTQGLYAGLPSIWKSNGKFDVFKMLNRYQILADYEARKLTELYELADGDPVTFRDNLESYVTNAATDTQLQDMYNMNFKTDEDNRASILDAITNAYIRSPNYQADPEKDAKEAKAVKGMTDKLNSVGTDVSNQVVADADKQTLDDGKQKTTKVWDLVKDIKADFSNSPIGGQFLSELHDGAQWISFRVDGKSSMSDSFGNSASESQISSTINSISAGARNIDFATSGGNTGFAPLDMVTKSIKDFISGGIDVLNISGIAGVFGRSNVDIPDTWDSSSCDIATESYTIKLRSPYGNDFSIFQNITVPLCCILAGVLPMSTGKQTYRNPFYCEVISRGRNIIRNGMITAVNITRGAGNMGWRADGAMLGADVTITVKDLSKVAAISVIKDPRIFADDNKYTDYMATLGAASLHDMTYGLSKLTLNFNMWKQSWKSAFMSGNIINRVTNGAPARIISGFMVGSARN